ncbi:phage holin family protein [Aeromicrobium sp. Marseille-Q0843]|uniref:Phage holin family protein n=1 Tax=Aeromicrobium phoceense TaxID=2754045 RepID=A0A838XB98_9ACTN|nr:phage holin family protein [Aeromicrobium phoceense]MBA4607182.1 phage holin family protein [Aeromicrobium phoceense]
MIRLLIRAAINLVSAAVGVLVANAVLDDLEVTASGFIITVVIFALAQAILSPFILVVVKRNAEAFLGGVGIVSTLVALWIASLFGDALTISGLSTWLIAAVIVWLAAALASFLLPFILLKAGVENARDRRA